MKKPRTAQVHRRDEVKDKAAEARARALSPEKEMPKAAPALMPKSCRWPRSTKARKPQMTEIPGLLVGLTRFELATP